MGDILGFLNKERALPSKQAVAQRIEHFEEFTEHTPEQHQEEQSARCMDCGVPFCHSACPLGNLIPDFNDAVHNAEWKLAYEILKSTNNFPEFTGRICPAPCEASCVLSINSEAVAIEYIEKSIIEKAFSEGWVQAKKPLYNGKKVAIVGSGPAGMACADQLNKNGYGVTVYEKNDRIGGLLRYGIPDFKLDKKIVQRRVDLMKEEGVDFVTSVNVGVDVKAMELLGHHDAVVLCGGSEQARDLDIDGRSLKGIYKAMDFLKQCNKTVAGDTMSSDEIIEVKGKKVVVIGGGDTGSDCIGNSRRFGADSILQIELMGKPPVLRSEDNPWPLWPMTFKTSSSQEEGCDREWAICTKRFLSEDGVHLSGIEVVRVNWTQNEDGKYVMTEVEGSSIVIECDVVFLAMGFVNPMKEGMLNQLALQLDERGNVDTTEYKTSVDRIFSAGDMRRGQSLVVWAIAEGRACAAAVESYLVKQQMEFL